MIGCLRTHVRKQPIIALYFESENELKLYNLEAWLTTENHDTEYFTFDLDYTVDVCDRTEQNGGGVAQ